MTKAKCEYDGTELDGAGECQTCSDLITTYGKERSKGEIGPAVKELLERALAESKRMI